MDIIVVFSRVWRVITDYFKYLKGEGISSVTNEEETMKNNQADLGKNQTEVLEIIRQIKQQIRYSWKVSKQERGSKQNHYSPTSLWDKDIPEFHSVELKQGPDTQNSLSHSILQGFY